ncbi:MAG: flavin reductase family protein [Firmicutes bacterium]|nr:flavin reductase family protein [Bacillota bacterium]
MFRKIDYTERMSEAITALAQSGAFLTVAANGKVNTMTIGWGTIGYIWGRPIMMVLVRPSRYTFGLLKAAGEFTVSIPLSGLAEELKVCGSKSGRTLDKLALTGLATVKGQTVSAPVIADCDLYYECKVVYQTQLDPTMLADTCQKWYPQDDYHTLFFGEITACYAKE